MHDINSQIPALEARSLGNMVSPNSRRLRMARREIDRLRSRNRHAAVWPTHLQDAGPTSRVCRCGRVRPSKSVGNPAHPAIRMARRDAEGARKALMSICITLSPSPHLPLTAWAPPQRLCSRARAGSWKMRTSSSSDWLPALEW